MNAWLEIAVKIAASIVAGGVCLVLIAATVRGCRRETARWKEDLVAKAKVRRLNLTLGQPVEVEYHVVPETPEFAADVDLDRVYAYSGAVRVEVTLLLRSLAPNLLAGLVDQCRRAEYGGVEIPF